MAGTSPAMTGGTYVNHFDGWYKMLARRLTHPISVASPNFRRPKITPAFGLIRIEELSTRRVR